MLESVMHPSKQIFSIYAGLTAAGYDMAPPSRLVSAIRDANWPDEVLAYFGEARTGGCAVNPYWPRAFLLALASLYLPESPPYRFPDRLAVARHVESLDSVSPDEKDEDTVDWILGLPEVYGLLSAQPVLETLWDLYQGSIDLARWNSAVSEAESLVAKRMGIPVDVLPRTMAVPNPLQAPEQTDAVAVGGTVYLIAAEPDTSSCVHEILHDLLTPALQLAHPMTDQYAYLLTAVLNDMLRLAYAWDESAESWRRVFQEQFIRAAEIWVSHGGDPKLPQYAGVHADQGFQYVPAIVRQFQTSWSGMLSIEDFIADCLRACSS